LNELARLEDELLVIEARVGLLDACRPLGRAREEARLGQALLARAPSPLDLVPVLDFPRWPTLALESARLQRIERACQNLAGAGGLAAQVARILAERAEELLLEVQIIEARGTSALLGLSARRFQDGTSGARASADALAREWLREGPPLAPDELAPLDAGRTDAGLVDLAGELRRLCERAGVAAPVREVELAARAAVTEKCLLVRRGARVTAAEAARIFTHEVHGHWLPRQAARENGCPLRIGPRGADGDEEGRALHLEQVGGHLDRTRRYEIAVRHVLAADVLDGRPLGETLLALHREGVPASVLASAAPRVLRAGGLCREIVYLPGLLRVGPRLAEPEVERVFRAGRATLAEAALLARVLRVAQPAQSKSATTGV